MKLPAAALRLRLRNRAPRLTAGLIILVWLAAMTPLLSWGVPSDACDPLLFGGDAPWPAERYAAVIGAEADADRDTGADVDVNPVADRTGFINLTATEANRAEILLRYRLYSQQPDEMLNFRALRHMRQHRLDPGVYQYGGAWYVAVGGALGLAHVLHLATLTGDLGYYLERPDKFASFYVAARAVSLAFSVLLLWAAYRLGRRASGWRWAGVGAMAVVAATGLCLNASLEAKPHLASTAMTLWAVEFALRFLRHRRRRDAVLLGLAGGLASALVLTGAVALSLCLAIAVVFRASRRETSKNDWRRLALATGLMLATYAVCNPYLLLNLVLHPARVTGNIGNTAEMFPTGNPFAGAIATASLLVESCGLGIVVFGVLGAILLLRRNRRVVLVAAAPGLVLLIACVVVGAGKPGEFARFLLTPAMLLSIATVGVLTRLARWRGLIAQLALVGVLLTGSGWRYWMTFYEDVSMTREQLLAEARLATARISIDDPIGVVRDPAPYCAPPMDFTRRRLILLPDKPPASSEPPPWLIVVADDKHALDGAWWRAHYATYGVFRGHGGSPTPISWARKPVFVFKRMN